MDNNQQKELSSKEVKNIETVSETVAEEVMKEFRFVIIGGNEPLLNQTFLDYVNERAEPVTIFEMTSDEMKFIINSRAQKNAEQLSVEYLNSKENKERVNEWVHGLVQEHLKTLYGNSQSKLFKAIEDAYDGKAEVIFNKKTLKTASKLSWKQFEELFANLELFGVVKYKENLSDFTLIMHKPEVFNNQMTELKKMIGLALGKSIALRDFEDIIPEAIAKLDSIKSSLSEAIEKI